MDALAGDRSGQRQDRRAWAKFRVRIDGLGDRLFERAIGGGAGVGYALDRRVDAFDQREAGVGSADVGDQHGEGDFVEDVFVWDHGVGPCVPIP